MSGDALTTHISIMFEFSGEFVEIDPERVFAVSGKRQQEIGSVEAGDACRHFLRYRAPAVPVHRSGQPQLSGEPRRILSHHGDSEIGDGSEFPAIA
jgi:hypothetical protein